MVAATLREGLGPASRAGVDPQNNSLVVTGTEEQIEALRRIIAELDQAAKDRPTPRKFEGSSDWQQPK